MTSEVKLSREWFENFKKQLDLLIKEKRDLGGNPFLLGYINDLIEAVSTSREKLKVLIDAGPSQIGTTDIEALPTDIKGILSPTMLVDALGSLIAQRFKEELTIKYLQKFREKLEKNRGLKELFPSVIDILINSDLFNFKQFLPILKEAFQNDLNNFDTNFIKYLKVKSVDLSGEIVAKKNQLILKLVLFIGDTVLKIKEDAAHPAKIIKDLSQNVDEAQIDPQFSAPLKLLKLLALVSRNLTNKEGDGWITLKEFTTFIDASDRDPRKLFIGLIYAKEITNMDEILFKGKSLKTIVLDNAEKFLQVDGYFHRLILMKLKIQNTINEIKEMQQNLDKDRFKKYHFYLTAVYELTEFGTNIWKLVDDGKIPGKIIDYLGYAKKFLEISRNIHDKVYSVALIKSTGSGDLFANDISNR
jgi:hypothetical protein